MRIDYRRIAKALIVLVIVTGTANFGFSDELVRGLISEFEEAGIDLRLDYDETLKSDTKIFDGFVKNPERVFECGIFAESGKKYEKNDMVFFQIRKNGELRQIYLGHLIVRQRHKKAKKDDFASSRLLISAEKRAEGILICDTLKDKNTGNSKSE
jgi:hypothetical protein